MKSKLMIGGVPAGDIARAVGTPVMVYDEAAIEKRLADYQESFSSPDFDTEIVYASKAFTCRAMIEKIQEAGVGLDVVSSGEMQIAHDAGMDMSRVYFHGNNKTEAELAAAVEMGCGNIVLDNRDEVSVLIRVLESAKDDYVIHALLRVNPLVEAHTHEFIQTAASDSKFGISIEEKEDIASLIQLAETCPKISFEGFHSHIGSQIFGSDAFCRAADKLVAFMKEMKEEFDVEGRWLSLGGGFGIRYTDEDQPMETGELCRQLIDHCRLYGYPLEKVMIEPGRSIAGEAGVTLYTCGYEKVAGGKRYLFVDGGMGDNIRPALYDAVYDGDLAERLDEEKDTEYCVAGKYCESGDVLIKSIKLPRARPGDILVTYATGAYGYSMASCYNGMGKPAVVFAKEGKARLVIRRERTEDLMRQYTDEEVNL